MTDTSLALTVAQYSDAGQKALNQDYHGFLIPSEPQLGMKGAAFVVADGISSSSVSHLASQTAVKSFLEDYFCTSEAWSVQHAGLQVLRATNAWLHAQTRQSPFRYDRDKGYVCTLSALVLKGIQAHILHMGDSRVYRLRNGALEQLTHDHRVWFGEQQSYLSRALGADPQAEIDYHTAALQTGDCFLLSTDGVHERLGSETIIALLQGSDQLEQQAKHLAQAAIEAGSDDNLTVLLVRVDRLPARGSQLQHQVEALPLPPILQAGDQFDGFSIRRQLHASSRSHLYLAERQDCAEPVVIKTPSIDMGGDPAYLERLLMEEWIARRVSNPHLVRAAACLHQRSYLYTVCEYIEGQTLRQWMLDQAQPSLETVRGIIEQVARALQALHRAEIIHQDLRPENIMIDSSGTVKLIDLGSAQVAGIREAETDRTLPPILGTALYTAPEYFIGELGSRTSDLYSLAVLAYHLLSGEFPYGNAVSRCTSPAQQHKLRYRTLLAANTQLPIWVDETLRCALQTNPQRRYQELSEFIYDLRHPNHRYLHKNRPPLLQRNPLRFWQCVSALLAIALLYQLGSG